MKRDDVFPDQVMHRSGSVPARPELPPGGDAACDAAYKTWNYDFIAVANLRWCDRWWPETPEGEILNPFQLTNHLHHWLIGFRFPKGSGPSFPSRLRFVAVQFRLRPEEIRREASRYLAERIAAQPEAAR